MFRLTRLVMSLAGRFSDRLRPLLSNRATAPCRSYRPQMERLEPREMLAVDVSPAPFLQWFEASYETMIDRAPDLFQAG